MTTAQGKCAVFSSIRGFGLVQSRLPLIQELISKGWRVVIATVDDKHSTQLVNVGAILEPVLFQRGGLSITKDSQAYLKLLRIIRHYKPSLVHLFHAKPIILGGLASRTSQYVIVISTVTGIGGAYNQSSTVRKASSYGYRLSMKRSQVVIFQNPDDKRLFLEKGWLVKEKAKLIIASGVDTDRFKPDMHPSKQDGKKRVLMVSRLLWGKGVREYVEAAELVKLEHPDTDFQLAGEWDPVHPDAVEESWVKGAHDRGIIEFLGYLIDMPEKLRSTDIFVLPTYYGEGVPRVIPEASACAVPVVATDVPGCREAVLDGETGLLVPAQDIQALAEAISKLLGDENLRIKLGANGRRMVEERFDIRDITQQYLDVYRSVGIDI